MTKNLDPRTKAIGAQLRTEITRSKHGNVAAFARALGVDYTTLYQRTRGHAAVPMEHLFTYLDALGVEPEDFFEDTFRSYRRSAGVRSATSS